MESKNIHVLKSTQGPLMFSWTNNSLNQQPCPRTEIQKLGSKLVEGEIAPSNKSMSFDVPSSKFKQILGDDILVKSISLAYLGTCSIDEMMKIEEDFSYTLETECSVACGPGVKTNITITCVKSCFPNCCQRKVEEIECQLSECENDYGPWSDWSECSNPCITNIYERSNKQRIRTCVGCKEEKEAKGTFRQICFGKAFFIMQQDCNECRHQLA